MSSSWNHHDTTYNQAHAGSNNLVGFTFKQNDTITIEIDYYNSVIYFFKNSDLDDMEEET